MDARRGRGSARPRAAELAWRLEQLCEAGVRARGDGWCLGELRPREIDWTEQGARRSSARLIGARLRQLLHARRGHDAWCRAIGVPRRAVLGLLAVEGGADALSLLEDAVSEAVDELSGNVRWSAAEARETVALMIRRRITPVRPPSAEGQSRGRTGAAAGDQMPRLPSNSAASSRFFT